jgi:hypothetical protein
MPTRKMTYDAAVARFRAYVTKMLPEEQQDEAFKDFGTTYMTFVRGIWADEATLAINSRDFSVSISWGGTSRTIAQAALAIANYRDALDMAMKIQAFVDSLPSYESAWEQGERQAQEAEMIKEAARKVAEARAMP